MTETKENGTVRLKSTLGCGRWRNNGTSHTDQTKQTVGGFKNRGWQ